MPTPFFSVASKASTRVSRNEAVNGVVRNTGWDRERCVQTLAQHVTPPSITSALNQFCVQIC